MDFKLPRWLIVKAEVLIVGLVILSSLNTCRAGILSSATSIDALLDNYGKPSQRPTEDGNYTLINIALRVTHLHSVKEIEMEMDSTMILYASWYDYKLARAGRKMKKVENIVGDSINKIWKPDVYFVNGKEVEYDLVPTEGRTVKLIKEGALAGVFYIVRLHLISSCQMSLELFPFDHQQCSIIISSMGNSNQDLRFRWFNEERDGLKPVKLKTSRLAQFKIAPHIDISDYTMVSEIGAENVSYLSTTFTLQRDPIYYFWSYYLPSSLLVILSWVNFWIDVDAAPARISLGTTLVLTVITLIYSARTHLPKIAYPTAITVWLDAQGIFVVLALVEYALTHQLNYQDKLQKQRKERKLLKIKNKEKQCEEDAKKECFYQSGYTKEIYQAFDADTCGTTHAKGTSFLSRLVKFFGSIFGGKRGGDNAVNDEDSDAEEQLAIGKYRWWALEIDMLSRSIFPIVYFLLVTVYVCAYRVWEVYLTEFRKDDHVD